MQNHDKEDCYKNKPQKNLNLINLRSLVLKLLPNYNFLGIS